MFSHPWAAETVNKLFIECSSSSNAPHPHVHTPRYDHYDNRHEWYIVILIDPKSIKDIFPSPTPLIW